MANPMEDIMNGIVKAADKDMKEHSIVYRDLSASAKDDRQTIFDIYDLAVSDATIAMSQVIKEKYGIKRISDDLYGFIRDFPSRFHRLSRQIEKDEGPVCCVDKAWSRMMREFDHLVQENITPTTEREDTV